MGLSYPKRSLKNLIFFHVTKHPKSELESKPNAIAGSRSHVWKKISKVKYRETKNRGFNQVVKSRRRSKNYDSFRVSNNQKSKIIKKKFEMPDKKWKYKKNKTVKKEKKLYPQKVKYANTKLDLA